MWLHGMSNTRAPAGADTLGRMLSELGEEVTAVRLSPWLPKSAPTREAEGWNSDLPAETLRAVM